MSCVLKSPVVRKGGDRLQEHSQVLHFIFLGLNSESPPNFISIKALVRNLNELHCLLVEG